MAQAYLKTLADLEGIARIGRRGNAIPNCSRWRRKRSRAWKRTKSGSSWNCSAGLFRRTRAIRATRSSKFAPAPAGRNRRCSPRILPDVHPLREAQRLESRNAGSSSSDLGGLQGSHFQRDRHGCLQAPQIRKRRASRATRSRHRSAGTHPHQHRHRRRPAGSRGSGYRNQTGRSGHHRLPRLGPGRPGRQHHRFGRADHPQTDRRDVRCADQRSPAKE